MNAMHAQEHDWAVKQLAAFSLGLLPEEQTLRLDSHLRDCADCRARLEPQKAVSRADVGHLPASLIATWSRSSRQLSGVERTLVESHLHACEECRATLAFAGHEPVLAPQLVVTPMRAVRAPARRSVWNWALGLSAVSAAAAAWLFVVQPALLPHDTHTSATMGALGHRAAAFELALPADTPGAVELPAAGAADAAAVIPVGMPTAAAGVALRLPAELQSATAAAGSREVALTLLHGGLETAGLTCRASELGGVVRLRPAAALPPGDYELRVSLAGAGTVPTKVWTWTLRAR